MKKAVLVTFVALMAVAMLATPIIATAMAGKGEEKLYYEFFLQGAYGPGPDTKSWTTPDGITQVRNLVYTASYIEVTVGATKYYPAPSSYTCTMDFTLDTNTRILYARIHESFAIAGGTITQHTAEVITEYGTHYHGGGNFVGFGSGTLEGVKIQGTTAFAMKPILGAGLDRVGTVMGW